MTGFLTHLGTGALAIALPALVGIVFGIVAAVIARAWPEPYDTNDERDRRTAVES